MKVLILGGTGMLGHKLYQTLEMPCDAWITVRGNPSDLALFSFYCPDRVIGHVDGSDLNSIGRALDQVKPDVVVNCIGIVKQHALGQDAKALEAINGRLPHELAARCREFGARLIHISTDCVFSGSKGHYSEEDFKDAKDLYGQSKARGEVQTLNSITLRTSIIGRELRDGHGLVEWFLSQGDKPIPGYTRAIFSGLTTLELARVIQTIIVARPKLSGIYQVASEPIDKFALLHLLRGAYGRTNDIQPCDRVQIDRSLDGSKFRQATGYVAPAWEAMIREMACDPNPYDVWRSH